MTGPRRVLSRVLLALLGLILMAAGAATAAAGLYPSFAAAWSSRGTAAWNGIQARLAAAPAGSLGISWWTLAALALLAVAVVLLVAWILSRFAGAPKASVPANRPGTPIRRGEQPRSMPVWPPRPCVNR